MARKPKFRVGQVVLCTANYEFVKILKDYRGRTSHKGQEKQLYVIGWEYGKSTTATESALRPLTAQEIGPRKKGRKGT